MNALLKYRLTLQDSSCKKLLFNFRNFLLALPIDFMEINL